MSIAEILTQIDREIAVLQKARSLLNSTSAAKSGRATSQTAKAATKRNLTPEGRRRIAEAVKRRWAAQRKATGKTAAK